MFKRWRIFTVLSVLFALFSAGGAFWTQGPTASETWAIVAAALSVLVAAISAWAAHETVELHRKESAPEVMIDIVPFAMGQNGVRIRNLGKTSALDVKVVWERPKSDRSADIHVKRVRPHEAMDLDLPEALHQSPEGYRASVTWKDTNGSTLKDWFDVTNDEIHARLVAKLRLEHDGPAHAFTTLSHEFSSLKAEMQQNSQQIGRLTQQLGNVVRAARR